MRGRFRGDAVDFYGFPEFPFMTGVDRSPVPVEVAFRAAVATDVAVFIGLVLDTSAYDEMRGQALDILEPLELPDVEIRKILLECSDDFTVARRLPSVPDRRAGFAERRARWLAGEDR
jgi:hypothetical protein